LKAIFQYSGGHRPDSRHERRRAVLAPRARILRGRMPAERAG
jgi:hypothetical protein